MKTRFLIIALLTFILMLSSAKKGDCVIVVLKGESTLFTNTLFSSFLARSEDQVFVHNFEGEKGKLNYRSIKKTKPELIITIGETPVEEIASNFKDIYVISVGHHNYRSLGIISNVIAVPIEVPADQAMQIARALFPNRGTIGVLYNPKLSSYIFDSFKKQVEKKGFKLAAIKVDSPQDVYLSINSFKGKIDLFYFIQDTTIFKSKSLNTIFSFLVDNKIPYIVPTGAFLRKYGVVALNVEPITMGRFLHRLTERIVKENKKKSDLDISFARMEVTFSLKNAKEFGIDSDKTLDFFRFITDKGYRIEVVE